MRSIVYAGNDFSEICSAEVIERAANPIVAEAMAVPGRAGALLVSGYIPPVDVRVRLFMDMGYNPGFTDMAQMRGKVNLPRFRLHPYAAFRRRSSSGRLARSNSSGLRYPSAEWVLALS